MLKPVLNYFNSITPLSAELVHEIGHHAVIKEYKKGEFILKADKVSNYTSWILKGPVRSYYVRDGEEITTKFLWDGAPITSIYSYYSRKPGIENIATIEDTFLASYEHMQHLYKTYAEFNAIGR